MEVEKMRFIDVPQSEVWYHDRFGGEIRFAPHLKPRSRQSSERPEMRYLTIQFLLLYGFLLLLALAPENAAGQADKTNFTEGVSTSQANYNVTYSGGGYGGYWGGRNHASTAQEGMARGMADVIRSRGEAAVDLARASLASLLRAP